MTDIYGSIASYKDYRLSHDTVAVTDTDDAITAALLVASEYIDGNYKSQFPGQKTGLRPQVREWPRTGAYDCDRQTIESDEIPREVEAATYEAAKRQLAKPGSLRTDVTLGKTYQSASVPGAVSVVYAGAGTVGDLQLSIPAIDAILEPILTGEYGGNSLVAQSTRV